MRRAGWKVWVADELDGSYEEVPPNLLDELQRDRRWCHGNLQNSRLMFEPRPASGASHRVPDRRAGLRVVAALARVPAALDAAVRAARRQRPDVFHRAVPAVPDLADRQRGADADAVRPDRACCCSRRRCSRSSPSSCAARRAASAARRACWRARSSSSSHSLLLAPVRMLFHTQFVARRADRLAPRLEVAAARRRRDALARGGARGTACTRCWRSPGSPRSSPPARPSRGGCRRSWPACCAAIPLSVYTSRVAIGRALRRRGLMLTPEESREPRVLQRSAQRRPPRSPRRLATLRDAVVDRGVQQRVVAGAAARVRAARRQGRRRGRSGSSARCATGPRRSPATTRLRLLSSRAALALLHREVVAGRAHPDWRRAPEAAVADDDLPTAPMRPCTTTSDEPRRSAAQREAATASL